MAQRKQTRSSQPARRQQRPRRRPVKKPSFSLASLWKPKEAEFKPDTQGKGFLKKLYMTEVQRNTYLKWGSYALLIILLLTIQDVIMSRITIFGGTTDLAVCAILLITVIEGVEVGSLFVLIASCLYYFSGSSPGPYSISLLTVFGIAACLFRQLFWHRNAASIVLCAGLALMLYEVGTFVVGLLSELTRPDCLIDFIVTAGLSIAVMIPLYFLFNRIGQIGGHTWKE
jgi:hypothetical protein